MRIAIYDPYLSTLGGGEKYMLTAASCLSQNNEVFLMWNEDVLSVSQKKFNLDLSKVRMAENIFNPNVTLFKRFVESKKYDAIFFLSDGSLPIVACDLYVHFQFPVEWVNSKSFIENFKLRRIKKIICNSNFTKSHIDRKFNIDSLVLYPPTYLKSDFPKTDYKKKKNILLNVGRYGVMLDGSSFKKQEFLIDSFKKLYDAGLKDWQLHIVLSYTDKDLDYIRKIRKSVGNYPIKVLENISYNSLLNEYEESKIYWHASGFGEDLVIHPEKAEHFGITTVEAMINGLVPVVINAGGQKEIVQENNSGFLWTTQEELLYKTLLLTKDKEKLKQLSENAIKESKVFSTNNFCDKINGLFIK